MAVAGCRRSTPDEGALTAPWRIHLTPPDAHPASTAPPDAWASASRRSTPPPCRCGGGARARSSGGATVDALQSNHEGASTG
jgi:hypothetical protein